MSQPVWKTVYNTDYSRLQIDTTGVYAPELEIAQEYEDRGKVKFQLYRFPLDRQKIVKTPNTGEYLVPYKWDPSWTHPLPRYEEWYVDSLKSIASSAGTTVGEMVAALTSSDPKARAWAYENIGGYHGYDNFDSYPQTLTEAQLNKRWR